MCFVLGFTDTVGVKRLTFSNWSALIVGCLFAEGEKTCLLPQCLAICFDKFGLGSILGEVWWP